jgi:tetrachlorobenzoquinone reductase
MTTADTSPDSARQLVLRVQSVSRAAEGVVLIELVDPSGADLPPWEPGGHLELELPSGTIRQYSLCGPASSRTSYVVAVLRVADGRGGSIEVHDTGLVGRELVVRGPRNRFPLVDAPSYLLLAGGIGVTPIVAMARELTRAGRPFRLVYGARTSGAMAFRDELRSLGEHVTLVAEDVVGRPDFGAALAASPPGTAVYCCGPEPMIAVVQRLCEERAETLSFHFERFAGSGTVEALRANDGSFELELRRSGILLVVPPDRTALDLVREVVPSHPYSCTEGECGSCEVRVLEGEIDHRDEVLSDEERAENGSMMICVSRARSPRIVIDL